jgi:hypothetical protein
MAVVIVLNVAYPQELSKLLGDVSFLALFFCVILLIVF